MKKDKKEIITLWKSLKKSENGTSTDSSIKLIDQVANFFTAGKYFYYVFDFGTYSTLKTSGNIENILGLKDEHFDLTALLETVHPRDVPIVRKCEAIANDFMHNHIKFDAITNYKVVYPVRFKKPSGEYGQFLHQAITLTTSVDNKINTVLSVETDISHLTPSPQQSISFLDMKYGEDYLNIDLDNPEFVKQNTLKSHFFSSQEIEILKRISFGQDTQEIAAQLYISPNTVRTHRQNILNKTESNNMTSLIASLIRKGII